MIAVALYVWQNGNQTLAATADYTSFLAAYRDIRRQARAHAAATGGTAFPDIWHGPFGERGIAYAVEDTNDQPDRAWFIRKALA